MNQHTLLLLIGAVTLLAVVSGYVFQSRSSWQPMGVMGPMAQSHRSYVLRSDAVGKTYAPNTPMAYAFSIIDDGGKTVKDFQIVHEKVMHMIVVRKDLAEFQHVHPAFDQKTGQFTLADLTFSSDGPYRIFADFTPTGAQAGAAGMSLGVTLYEDVSVGNLANYKPQPLTETSNMKTFEGYEVQLATNPVALVAQQPSIVSFTIRQDGKPVTNLETYLGALGHSVVLSEGDLEFIHTHALSEDVAKQTGTVDFEVVFPKTGKYKLFTQFQHQGKVTTTSYIVSVAVGAANSSDGSMMMPNDMMNAH